MTPPVEKYRITMQFDWAEEPNLFVYTRPDTIEWLTRVGVPFSEETLIDGGGPYRIDDFTVTWALDTTVEGETHGRGSDE